MSVIDDVELTRRAGEVQLDLLAMQSTQTLARLPDAIDWEDDDPRASNVVMRAYWEHVQSAPARPERPPATVLIPVTSICARPMTLPCATPGGSATSRSSG